MHPIRVLIVEDDEHDAELIVTRLRRGGIELRHERVDTAEQLRAVLRDHCPDVVISDYNLPSFTAEQALQILADSDCDAPFLLVSGQVGEETAAAMMRAGAHDFILKDRMDRLVPAVQRELRDADERRQRRRAEAALRDSEQRFRLLAEHAIDIVFRYRLHPDRRLDYISPAVTAVTGYQPTDLYADPDLITNLLHPDDRAAFDASWRQDRPPPLLLRWRRRDGTEVWIEQRTLLAYDQAGQPVAVEGILRDVTDQHLAELERQRLDQQLRQAERLDSLGHLAGGIAHDFNNLLAVITAYAADLAADLGPEHPSRPDADRISHAADRAAALTRQLLIFSRLEPSQPELVDLNTVVADTEQLLRRTIGEDITFTTDLQTDLPPVTIDRSKLEQIIVNLVVNARAAMSNGGQLTITTRHHHNAAHGERQDNDGPDRDADRVELAVTDTGCGMTPEVASRAFEPFFTTKGPGHGTGLGLATAYGVITAAGGDITINTTPGQGTTMTVLLPATNQPAVTDDHTDTGATRTANGNGQSVIVVEDDPDVRDIVLRILTRAGYQTTAPATPDAAIAACTDPTRRIDALITDVVMPGVSGPELAEHARHTHPNLPVLYISGYTAGTLPGAHHLSNDLPLLRKPFTAPQLLQRLTDLLHPRPP